jgi:hypothetical protein
VEGYRNEWRFLILVWAFLGVTGLAVWIYGVEHLPDGTADVSMAVAAVVSVLGTLVPNLTNPDKYTWLLSRRGVGVIGLLTLFSGVAVAGSYGASIRAEAEAKQRGKRLMEVKQERDEARQEIALLRKVVGSEPGATGDTVFGRLANLHALLGDGSGNGVLARLRDLDRRLPESLSQALQGEATKNGMLAIMREATPKVNAESLAEALQIKSTGNAMRAIVDEATPKVNADSLTQALRNEAAKNAMLAIVNEATPKVNAESLTQALRNEAARNAMLAIVNEAAPKVNADSLTQALRNEAARNAMLAIVNEATPKVNAGSLAAALKDGVAKEALLEIIGEVSGRLLIAALKSEEGKQLLRESHSCN